MSMKNRSLNFDGWLVDWLVGRLVGSSGGRSVDRSIVSNLKFSTDNNNMRTDRQANIHDRTLCAEIQTMEIQTTHTLTQSRVESESNRAEERAIDGMDRVESNERMNE
uniref:Uncharacterized protein n=1 Tax=Onchocerca volvulus TaxID=6282 RepID=A0A8R1XZE1_ONCVO